MNVPLDKHNIRNESSSSAYRNKSSRSASKSHNCIHNTHNRVDLNTT